MNALRILTLLSATIFFGELAVMHLLGHLSIGDETLAAFVDSAMLLAIVFPVLYFAVIRSLIATKSKLEAGIRERTSDIEHAQHALETTVGRLKSHQKEMILLGEMGSFFQSCTDLDEAMNVAEVELARLFPDMSGALFIMNSSRNILERRAMWGAATEAPDHLAPVDCWALRRSKPHVAMKEQHTLACRHTFFEDTDWQICLPLVAHGDALGTLCMASRYSHSEVEPSAAEIDSERMQFFLAAGENLALAVSNLRLREKLSFQALRDPLTGLFNRRYLLETLDRELDRAASLGHPLSVAMFDIDYFKKFNDSHGHAAGDFVLSSLGAKLLEWAKGEDIPVRFGGEEFTVVMPDTSVEQAFLRIESLRQAIEVLAIEYAGGSLGRITISAGIAAYPLHGKDKTTVIDHADQALYKSKQDGRNRTTMTSESDRAASGMLSHQAA